MYEVTEYNCATGETIVRPMTDEERADLDALIEQGNSF